MKKILATFFSFLILGGFTPTNALISSNHTEGDIIIELSTTEKNNVGKEDKTLAPISAIYYPLQSVVVVDVFNSGEGEAVICASNGAVLSSVTLSSNSNVGTLSVPNDGGLYYVVINCSRCYSYGYFIVNK